MAARSGFRRRLMNMVSAPFAITLANLIDVAEEEAAHFSCNAVVLDRDIVLPEGAPKLVDDAARSRLQMSPVADDANSSKPAAPANA